MWFIVNLIKDKNNFDNYLKIPAYLNLFLIYL